MGEPQQGHPVADISLSAFPRVLEDQKIHDEAIYANVRIQKIYIESEIENYCESLGLNKAFIFTKHHWEIRRHENGKWLIEESQLSKALKKIERDPEEEIIKAIKNIRNTLK